MLWFEIRRARLSSFTVGKKDCSPSVLAESLVHICLRCRGHSSQRGIGRSVVHFLRLSQFVCYNNSSLRSVIFSQWDTMQDQDDSQRFGSHSQWETVAFCVLGAATLCLISRPIEVEWGSNGDVLDKSLCLQQWRLGINGDESCNSFRNGDRGRGRGMKHARSQDKSRSAHNSFAGGALAFHIWLLHSAESEVRVNRFEGHRAQHAFRPKVNGWTEGTEWELA